MFLWVTRSIARFSRRLTHKTRQVQHNMSHCGIIAGEENKPKAGHVILSLFGYSSKVIPKFFIWEGDNKMGTSPVSSTSTLVEHGGVVGKWIMQLFHAGFCLGVGEHEGLIATAKFRRNTIIPCMLLQSFDCRSRSNRPCAAKVKNHVCRMVSKIQRGYCHPCSVCFCAKPPSIWSPGIVSPMAGRPIVSFPSMAVSFFRWVFLRLKIRIEDKFLPCLFLFGPFLCLCCGDNPCLRLCLGGKGENHPSDSHHCLLTSLSCLCFLWTTKQSPFLTKFRDLVLVLRQGMLFRFFRIYLCAFLFPFLFFLSAGGPYMVWTARHTQCRPMSRNMIFHHQRNLARQSLHPWPIVQSRLQHSLPRWRFCSCYWRVRSRGVKDFTSSFSANKIIPEMLSSHPQR